MHRLDTPHHPTLPGAVCTRVLIAPGLPQYIASLDAENSRMMAEIQGMSAGGGLGGNFGLAGVVGDPNAGSPSLFPGMAGGGTAGYLGPGLHVNQAGMDGRATGVGQGAGGGNSSTVARKKGRATAENGAEDEWDAVLMGGGADGGEPLSPRNREYRRKMIEMNAEHRVRVLGHARWRWGRGWGWGCTFSCHGRNLETVGHRFPTLPGRDSVARTRWLDFNRPNIGGCIHGALVATNRYLKNDSLHFLTPARSCFFPPVFITKYFLYRAM